MLSISIYRGNQRPKAHAAFDGDLPQTVPELVFKADAGPVAFDSNRALRRALRRVGHRLYSRRQLFEADAIPREFTVWHLDRNRPFRDGHHIGRPKQGLTKKD
jgi:hypothetical protein